MTAFEAKDRAGALRGVSDEETHLWVACLDIDGNAVFAQFVRRRRPYRGDGDRLETLANRIFEIVLPGNLEQMNDLHRRRKQRDINLTVRHSSCGLLQRPGVRWERVPVYRHTRHRSTSRSKPIQELRIRCAVFLDGNPGTLQPELGRLAIEGSQQLTPGVWLGRSHPRCQTD